MNDLSYTEWMKFQKSFFRFQSTEHVARASIDFFTKARWQDGTSSRSLVIGIEGFEGHEIPGPRVVEVKGNARAQDDILSAVERDVASQGAYDFILIDLTRAIPDPAALSQFLSVSADRLFGAIRRLLAPDRYCAFLVRSEEPGGGGFPLAWSIALSARAHLRLRDERVGLVLAENRLLYSLIMQAADDKRPPAPLRPEELCIGKHVCPIPAWTIPKPPPRRKGELLHPAKFPETLVGEFIELFTVPGASVFDPMVGTGSTVVAALRLGRSGYGIDLSSRFVETSRRRATEELQLGLFSDEHPNFRVLEGDATKLDQLAELKDLQFDYVVTSPPYWSMLTNPGSENQEARRRKNLPLIYSDHENDLGNVGDYERFLDLLEDVYEQVSRKLVRSGCMTVVVKNVKRDHVLYPLAWDLVARLCRIGGRFEYLGTTLWCQDDVGLKPFAVGIHWVSNILHHYCLHFRRTT